MLKIIGANAAFAAIVWMYYLYVGGNRPVFVQGTVLAFVSLACGILIGALLAHRRQARPSRRRSVPRIDEAAFDQIA